MSNFEAAFVLTSCLVSVFSRLSLLSIWKKEKMPSSKHTKPIDAIWKAESRREDCWWSPACKKRQRNFGAQLLTPIGMRSRSPPPMISWLRFSQQERQKMQNQNIDSKSLPPHSIWDFYRRVECKQTWKKNVNQIRDTRVKCRDSQTSRVQTRLMIGRIRSDVKCKLREFCLVSAIGHREWLFDTRQLPYETSQPPTRWLRGDWRT